MRHDRDKRLGRISMIGHQGDKKATEDSDAYFTVVVICSSSPTEILDYHTQKSLEYK